MSMQPRARWRTAIVAAALLLISATPAGAEGRTDFLIGRMSSDDFRVRTNAALALGATNDDAAVSPLCTALDDTSEVVRQASAVALKRLLKPSATGCLKRHLSSEKNDSVRLQISRAVEAIEASAGDEPSASEPRQVAGAKYYVAVAPVTNNTTRGQAEVEKIVGSAVRSKLDQSGQVQLAPQKEAPDAARSVMNKRKLKGFYLTLAVDKLDYGQDGLKVTVRLVVFNYPGKAMQGMLNSSKLQPGARPGDRVAEDALLAAASASVIDTFAQNAANF